MALTRDSVLFTLHAAEGLAELGLSAEELVAILNAAELIGPESLWLGWHQDQPVHVAMTPKSGKTLIITVYAPDPAKWSPDFRRRLPK